MSRLKRHARTLTALAAALASPALFAGTLFEGYTATSTGSWPEAVAIGDINGDGLNDVVMTTWYGSYGDPDNYKLFVFLQDPSGALLPPVKYATAATYTNAPSTVAIGDVDGDGLNDVVVGISGTGLQVFRQASGQLAAPSLIQTPYAYKIRIGDLNGDGRSDVAGIGGGTNMVGVFAQGLDGNLALAGAYSARYGGFDDLELGDVNNDGRTDIVVMSGQLYAYANLQVLTQTLDGKFSSAAAYDLAGDWLTQGVGIGDVNGDGLNDVVVSYGGNRPNARIAVFPQNGGGSLNTAQNLPAYDVPETVHVQDVNGDGLDDIVVLHGGWYRMGVYLQKPDGTLAAEELYPIPYASHYNPHGLAIGDINGDGKPDVAIADYNHGLVLLKNIANPNTPPVAAFSGPTSANRVSPASFDGNASSDANGDPLSFEWSIDGNPAGTGPALTTTFATLGNHTVALTVHDGAASATTSKTVSVENLAPTVSAGVAQTVAQKTPVSLAGSASDQDGAIAAYQWTQTGGPAVALKGANTRIASFTAPALSKGATATTLTFRLQATDNNGRAAGATTTVTVVKR